MVFDKDEFEDFKSEAEKSGIKVTKIGEVTKEKSIEVFTDDDVIRLSDPDSDELYKVIS